MARACWSGLCSRCSQLAQTAQATACGRLGFFLSLGSSSLSGGSLQRKRRDSKPHKRTEVTLDRRASNTTRIGLLLNCQAQNSHHHPEGGYNWPLYHTHSAKKNTHRSNYLQAYSGSRTLVKGIFAVLCGQLRVLLLDFAAWRMLELGRIRGGLSCHAYLHRTFGQRGLRWS